MFDGWDNFYIIIGSTAGALVGVMFVVATLSAGLDERTRKNPIAEDAERTARSSLAA
jgi:hypothetical protein